MSRRDAIRQMELNESAALRKLDQYRVERQYVGEEGWSDVDAETAVGNLSNAYRDVEMAVDLMLSGSSLRTSFAFYRIKR